MNTAIKINNVSKSFRDKVLYKNLNLEIPKGKCIGFVGTNGAGKSVLFHLICGLLSTDTGHIEVNGTQVGGRMGVFPENVGILINSPGYVDFYTGFYNLKLLAEIKGTTSDETIRQTMELCGLDPYSKIPVKKYSMGMKQKLGIAQAIMENQEILILDEPYNALDFSANKDITKIIQELHNAGKTILLTSHQHEYLEKLCDEIYFLHNKTLVPFTDELKTEYFEI